MHNLVLSPISTDSLIEQIAERTVELLKREPQQNVQLPEELLSRKQALDFLKITSATLWRWEKEGKIKSHGIGAKRYYKRSELEESLIEKK